MSLIESKQVVGNPRNFILVYNPAGVQAGNVYTDFNDLFDYALSLVGPVQIWCIESTSDIPIRTGGGAYDFKSRISLVGSSNNILFPNILRFDDGVTIQNLSYCSKLQLEFNNTSVPVYITEDQQYIQLDSIKLVNNQPQFIFETNGLGFGFLMTGVSFEVVFAGDKIINDSVGTSQIDIYFQIPSLSCRFKNDNIYSIVSPSPGVGGLLIQYFPLNDYGLQSGYLNPITPLAQ